MKLYLRLCLVSALAVPTLAFAAPPADTDGDNIITKAEFMAESDRKFAIEDKNQDGELTREEMQEARVTFREERSERRFDRLDANEDGVINEDEFQAPLAEREERIKDRQAQRDARRSERQTAETDGEEGANESASERIRRFAGRGNFRKAEGEGLKSRGTKNSDRKARGSQRGAQRGGQRGSQRSLSRDANGDGVITRAEHDAVAEVLFLRLDTNGDGVLTEGEGRKRQGQKRQGQKRQGKKRTK